MTTGKTKALTRQTFVGKIMSLLFNMLSRLVLAFLPRSKCLLISWLQSPSAVILEHRKIKSDTVSTVSPSISHEIGRAHVWTPVTRHDLVCRLSSKEQASFTFMDSVTIWSDFGAHCLIVSPSVYHEVSFHSNPKERQWQRMLKLPHNCTHFTG